MTEKYLIDISKHQAAKFFDWPVLAKNIAGVIIRASYGTDPDVAFMTHYPNAARYAIPVGAYHFFRGNMPWKDQIDCFCRVLDNVRFGISHDLSIVPVIDLEDNRQYDGDIDPDAYSQDACAAAERIKSRYGACCIYIGPEFFARLGSPKWIKDHSVWVAHRGASKPRWDDSWSMWQFTNNMVVPGYKGVLDSSHVRTLPLLSKPIQPPDNPQITLAALMRLTAILSGYAGSLATLADCMIKYSYSGGNQYIRDFHHDAEALKASLDSLCRDLEE